MARYFTTAVNGRGNTVSVGGQQAAGEVHLRGWDSGVRVVPVNVKGKPDEFLVYMTSGSHATAHDILVGRVVMHTGGPRWHYSEDYAVIC